LTEAQVREIRALARDLGLKGNASFIARAYGVSPTKIASIVAEKTWRDSDSDTMSGDNLI